MAAGKTIGELQKINDKRLSGGVADNLLEEAPAVRVLGSLMASNGTDHSWLQYTQAPPGGFRSLNDGIVQGESQDTLIRTPCEILDFSYNLDTRAVANYTQGDLIARENARHLRSSFAKLEQQIFAGTATNGTGSAFADDSGFEGIVSSLAGQERLDTIARGMVVNANDAGPTNLTSVYMVRSIDPLTDAAIVLGSDGNITVSPAVRQRVPGATGHYHAWAIEINSYYCWQWGGKFSAGRIANIDSTGSTLTDDMLAKLIALFPANRKPNLMFMNRDCERQLRESRTATNQTGAPAPFVESAFGIPVIVTDQIGNDENVVS